MAEETRKVSTKIGADDRYGNLDSSLVELLKSYEFSYFREDTPIPFCGLLIYPVQVRHYEEFASCTSCLTLNKNEDVVGIRLSHLDYLISKMKGKDPQESRMWSYKLQRLFEIIFRIDNGLKCKKCNHVVRYDSAEYIEHSKKITDLLKKMQENPDSLTSEDLDEKNTKFICPKCGGKEMSNMISIVEDPVTKKNAFSVDGHIINKNDFGKLRQIVLFQNYPEYADESNVDPLVKQDHDAKLRLQQQLNDVHATIEKKVTCLTVTTNYKYEDIYNMSIRRFTMALATVDDLINYKIMRQAVSSGFVSLPKGKKIEHWIYKPLKDIYGEDYKSMDEMQQEVSRL